MEDKITVLLEKVNDIEDEYLSSHLLNYICVLISGYLEKKIQAMIKTYKESIHFNTHECKNFIKDNIQNAKWCAIRGIFMNIDENILDLLKTEFNDELDNIIFSINNIVQTRHKIAHGENVTHLTIVVLNRDFNNIKQFIVKINDIFECL